LKRTVSPASLPISKSTPFGHLLFEKSKDQPLLSAIAMQFETYALEQEIRRLQRDL
jgi:hypothetical protein